MKEKKIPERMCIVCRQHKEKSALIRIVKQKSGELSLDPGGKAPGRGAYVCAEEECIKLAQKKSCLQRAFKMQIDGEIYEKLHKIAAERIAYGR